MLRPTRASTGCAICVFFPLSLLLTEGTTPETCADKEYPSLVATRAQVLLQAHRHTITSNGSEELIASSITEIDHKAAIVDEESTRRKLFKINPSGAAAPLTSAGYLAVADRCCQAEMRQFIERQMFNLGLQMCEISGLYGIVHYHTCPLGPQTFDKLTADLLADSSPRCRWLAPLTETCTKPFPEDCPTWEGIVPADCGCSRSAAAKLDLATSNVNPNNLAGSGPSSGAPEIRYTNGVSSRGQAFDLVVTAVGSYTPKKVADNGRSNSFGRVNVQVNSTVNLKFSFTEPGTDTPIILDEVHMASFDLDGTHLWGIESVSSKGYHGYVTSANPSVVASLTPDGRTTFKAQGGGDLKNPVNPNSLTYEQRRNSVMFFYKDVSSFEVFFHAEAPTGDTAGVMSGRNIFFAFESSLDDRCGP